MNRFKHHASISLVLGLLLMTCTLTLLAQTATSSDSVVPRLVNFSGKIVDVDTAKSLVTLEGPEGARVTFTVENPDNLKAAKVGEPFSVMAAL